VSEALALERRRRREAWIKRGLWTIGLIVFLVVAGLLGAAFLPRWWSHRIGAQVGGGIGLGIALGLFYGFVFTALPVAILRWAFRKRRAFKTWLIWVGVAIVVALPNLLTLGIVLGSGKAAHAGERTLDVEAPDFRASSLAGAILAVLAIGLWEYLRLSRRRARHLVDALQKQLRERETAQAAAPPPPPDQPA
jgi:hypothetical protein